MNWTIPGTALQSPRTQAPFLREQLEAMFLGGGMVLSQVTAVTGLETHTIQNWVKRGFLSPPVQKRYCLNQFCRIATINALKGVLPMERICGLLRYINGTLDSEADDLISDTELYIQFVLLASRVRELMDEQDRDEILDQALQSYQEPAPGAKDRVKKVLRVMLTAWLASRMCQEAEDMINNLEKENEL